VNVQHESLDRAEYNNLEWVRCILWCLSCSLGFLIFGFEASSQEPLKSDVRKAEFDCVIEPHQTVKLASPVVGVIGRLDVDRGDLVRQGQVIGKLEDGVEVAALELARARATNEHTVRSIEARLEYLRKKYTRLEELHSKAVTSRAALDEAESEAKAVEQQLQEAILNRELARLQMRQAEEVVNQRTLRSPINGVVVERLLVPGEYRNEQTPVITLAQIDPLRVEAYVATPYYGQIVSGSKAKIRPEEPIKGTYTATIAVVDHVLDAASGTFGVRLALPNPDLHLPAGIRCKVEFDMPLREKTPLHGSNTLPADVGSR
jgi:RND family efflux transporter MFP subunit